MNRSNPGERYLMGDLMGPDARFVDDMAILQRGIRYLVHDNPDNPFIKEQCNEYDRYQRGLSWHDCYIIPNETFDILIDRYHQCLATIGVSAEFGADESNSSLLSTIGKKIEGAGGFLIGRSVSGDYYLGLPPFGADGRFVDDLTKIDDYVRTQARPKIAQYPKSLNAVQDYEQWRQTFSTESPIEAYLNPNGTMLTAKAKLGAIKNAQGESLSESAVAPKDRFVSLPKDPTANSEKIKSGVKIVGAITGVILLLLGVRAVKRGAGRAFVAGVKTAASGIASGAKNISTKLLPTKSNNG